MKKIIHTLALIALFTAGLKAQKISYSYVKDDPFEYKNFSASIDPLFIDVNGHNGYAFGWGVRAEYMMGKRLLANFDMRIGFGTNKYRASNVNTKNYFGMDAGLGLIFVNRVKVKNVPIILSSSTSGNTRTTLSIKGGVPAKCRLIVALRGGITQYANTLDYTKLNDSLLAFERDGVKTTYAQAQRSDIAIFHNAATNTLQATVDPLGGLSLFSIYGGLQFRKIRNMIIDVDGYGTRGNVRYSDFYLDFIFAPVVKFRDFRSADQKNYSVSYGRVSHIGWRLGWYWRKPKEQGFSAKLELGSRPGFKADANKSFPINPRNLYGMITFGLYVPFKLKPIYTGED